MPQKPGEVFKDDPTIPPEMRVLHRVHPNNYVDSEDRPASSEFDNSSDGSGTSADLMEDDDQPERTLAGHEGFGLVALTVADIRAAGLGVVRNPVEGNPQHVLIQGPKKRAAKRTLARQAEWIKRPDKFLT